MIGEPVLDPTTIEHHDLAGLGDDDHTQYFLADGSRLLNGSLTQQNGDAILVSNGADNFFKFSRASDNFYMDVFTSGLGGNPELHFNVSNSDTGGRAGSIFFFANSAGISKPAASFCAPNNGTIQHRIETLSTTVSGDAKVSWNTSSSPYIDFEIKGSGGQAYYFDSGLKSHLWNGDSFKFEDNSGDALLEIRTYSADDVGITMRNDAARWWLAVASGGNLLIGDAGGTKNMFLMDKDLQGNGQIINWSIANGFIFNDGGLAIDFRIRGQSGDALHFDSDLSLVNFNNPIVVTDTTAAISKTTGCATFAGGLGIAGNIWANDRITLDYGGGAEGFMHQRWDAMFIRGGTQSGNCEIFIDPRPLGNNGCSVELFKHSFPGSGGTQPCAFKIWTMSASPSLVHELSTLGESVFNSVGNTSNDIRIKGGTDANLFFTDAGTDRVGVGTNAPTAKLDVVGSMKVSGDLGFFGASAVSQPTALTATDATVIDATYGAEEQGVIENLRTRVNELESKLQLLGLLS